MANIEAEINAFRNAIYGDEVRDAMVSLAEKVNTNPASDGAFVRYNASQTLSEDQKETARTNIEAAEYRDDYLVSSEQILTATEKAQVKSNLGLTSLETAVDTNTASIASLVASVFQKATAPSDVNNANAGFCAVSSTVANLPVAATGVLITFKISSEISLQFYSRVTSSNRVLYMRKKQSGTWGTWGSITFTAV